MSVESYQVLLLVGSVLGFYLAYLYGRKTTRFRWSEYFLMLCVPVLGSLGLFVFYGVEILYFFIASCFIGSILEYSVGEAYYKTLNERLWTYGKYSIGGYTSLLSFPIWGVAGTIFWLLAHSIGL